MRLFECFDALGSLTEEEFGKAIGIIESYIFRRAICGEQTRGYWQVFANLAYGIDSSRPFESLTVGLARQHDNYRFPTDAEFRAALEERDMYAKRVCFDLLDRLENHGSKEPTDTSKYSIEHIMPQSERLGAEWRKMLGVKWKDVQKMWLHRVGNLTLTGYNSTYSNRSFAEKKKIRGGFEESSVRLNKYVREQKVWNTAKIRQRGKALAGRALMIWPPLVVDKVLVDAAEKAKKSRADRSDVTKVSMTETARNLFETLRTKVFEIDGEIVELTEEKSVSYHAPMFFLEVLPRKSGINLLLAADFNEIDDPFGIASDTSERKFIVNAVYEGGVNVSIWTEDDIEKALPMIRQRGSWRKLERQLSYAVQLVQVGITYTGALPRLRFVQDHSYRCIGSLAPDFIRRA